MAGEQGGRGLSARSAAGPPLQGRPQQAVPVPLTTRTSDPSARTAGERVTGPDSEVLYVSVADAARWTGASVSAVRAWAHEGQVRVRTGQGPRGERAEVALTDVQGLADQPRQRASVDQPADQPVEKQPGAQLVPLATVEAMERLAGELYLAGQRAARAEAVAELRDRRFADLQQELDALQREATALWDQNQELLRRVAVAEARVMSLEAGGGAGSAPRWRLRRSP